MHHITSATIPRGIAERDSPLSAARRKNGEQRKGCRERLHEQPIRYSEFSPTAGAGAAEAGFPRTDSDDEEVVELLAAGSSATRWPFGRLTAAGIPGLEKTLRDGIFTLPKRG